VPFVPSPCALWLKKLNHGVHKDSTALTKSR